ncbi:acyl--CoA ligase [Phenylobacterium sp. LH3H17]|uniref:class I adenylate-forming enzyme family protein n=1 Tax=Phenylobacterium sp. LH3H17 TaxID=2903901 RepID=UPI0020CA0198|nr:class I adenylate-forming enzyme family protein [Phenylobacterium sp. LH3H17]UTP38274.1 acyl--CoA ligase [Phenylobacterium sp. LH3H17]
MARLTNFGDIVAGDLNPPGMAVIDLRGGERCFTRGQIAADIAALADGLKHAGYARGDRIAIAAENSYEFVLAYLAVMRAGLVVVPINFKLPAETIAYILRDAGVVAVLVDRERRHLVPPGMMTYSIDATDPDAFRGIWGAGGGPAEPVETGEIAEILYTSGSTGRPKGVPLSHDGQIWALELHRTDAADETTIVVAPLYHMNGLFNVTLGLINSVPIVLMPRFDARDYLKAIAKYRCTKLSGIPTMFALAARELDLVSSLDLNCVRQITIASAPLTAALVERVSGLFPNAAIQNGYGSTEAGPSIFGDHPLGYPRPLLSLGHPLPMISWRLTGGPSEDQGVLELKTPALLEGYLNLPEASGERIHDGWYVTGDVLRRDAQGFFYFVGRADDMFVCGGENVYPGEVEKMLERHPGVHQAAVVPVEDEIKGQIPIAFIVPSPGQSPSAADLKAFALREGPAYSHPRAFEILDALPVAGTHKVDKMALVKAAEAVARRLER